MNFGASGEDGRNLSDEAGAQGELGARTLETRSIHVLWRTLSHLLLLATPLHSYS